MKKTFLLIIAIIFFLPTVIFANLQPTMQLVGQADFRYMGIIKVYSAQFLVEPTKSTDLLSTETSRCLQLNYHVEIEAAQLAEAANTVLARQLVPEKIDELSKDIVQLHEAYRDVQEGDSYSLCYSAEQQLTTLSLNNQLLTSIQSAEFATAYFGIWLKETAPIDKKMRDNLLAGKEG